MAERVTGGVLINGAGVFYDLETIETMNFEEELKMIDICAVGPLRLLRTGNGGRSSPAGRSP